MIHSQNKLNLLIALTLGVFLGIVLGCLYGLQRSKEMANCAYTRQFIHHDIDCAGTDTLFKTISETQQLLIEQITRRKSAGDAERVSVFYRDLTTNRWFGIDEDAPFRPGSLLKLPLAIAYYKLSEVDPSILEHRLVFTSSGTSLNMAQHEKPDNLLNSGNEYSPHELIVRMIEESDNDPVPLLTGALMTGYLDKVYLDLGVHFPTTEGIEKDFVSVRTYASILRSLYYSTYLDPDNSEEILSLMSKSRFVNGIKSGLPASVPYANKFGEREYTDEVTRKTEFQLHDCGIVYADKSPYVLCVMTEGADYEKLKGVIADISKTTYERQGSQ